MLLTRTEKLELQKFDPTSIQPLETLTGDDEEVPDEMYLSTVF